jgi:hypothetical protein
VAYEIKGEKERLRAEACLNERAKRHELSRRSD